MYRVIGADGKEYGPVTLEQLKAWVAESRLNAQSKVRVEGSPEWRTAADFPEINALLTPALEASPLAPLRPGPAAPAGGQPFQGMAITSMVLGILSVLCFGLLTGIPAVICGHVAHSRARRNPAVFGGAGFAIAGLVMGYFSLLITLVILPAMLLPALSRAKERAQRINCVNNLKQVGLAFKVWSLDHNEQFPFNVSTNAGGTAELSVPDENGLDSNAAITFQVLSNELSTPKILVCPADSKKHAARDFLSLETANVSYELRSGTNISDVNPQEWLARCPIHNNVLLCDGSVQQLSRQRGLRIRK